ncbi:MAG: serine hydrolase domain-containing protein [Gemmataceae bacterium]
MNRLLPRLLTVSLAMLACGLAWGQAPNRLAEIAPKMQSFVDSGDLAGAVTLVGTKSGIVHWEAVGKADLESGRAMKKDDLFRIMSMTKPITAIAVMLLQDDGKLNVHDPVEKYLPEFQGQMLVESRASGKITLKKPARPITIHDLLTHTSGLPGGYPAGFADVYTKRNRTLNETTIAISQRPLEFEPGSKWSYCNAGMDTLGRLIEVVSGKSYESFLQTRIFDPLGMSRTTYYPTAGQMESLAVTYGKKNGKLIRSANLMVDYAAGAKHPIPAGGLFSTAADMAQLYRMMLNQGEFEGRRVLSEKAVAEMTRLQTGEIKTGFVDGMGYGYGWAHVREPKGVTASLAAGSYGHGGAFGTQGWIDPVNNRFYILMIQRTDLPNADASPMRAALQDLGAGKAR